MLKKILLVYCQLLLVCSFCCAQPIFQKRLQVAPNAGTIIKDAFELSDSTFIIIGTAADSASNYISFVAEVDTMGNILSNKTYYVNALEFGTRNVDNTLSYTGDSGLNKVLFLKTDLAGNLLTCFKIDFASECFVSDIIATSDSGNIILATNDFGSSGMEKEFGSVIKIDKTGNIQWVKHFGGTYQTYVNDAKEISPGVYEMYGSSTSLESDTLYYLNHNIFVLRLDSAGNQLSCHVVFEINKEYAWKYFIKANGNRLFALSSGKAGGGSNILITFIETDSSFNTLWSKSYFDGVNFLSSMNDLINLSDTIFITTYNGVRLWDSNGNLVRNRLYGQSGTYENEVFFKNSSYHIFCNTLSPFILYPYGTYIKANANLVSGCYEGNSNQNILVYNVPFAFQDTIIHDTIVSHTITFDSLGTGTINLFFDTDCFGYTNMEEPPGNIQSGNVYPNPFIDEFSVNTVDVRIKNVFVTNTLGQLIETNNSINNNRVKVLFQKELPKGIYVLNVILDDDNVITKKILKL